ncbi:MAG: pyridoxal phosphate-dependent aminotransferase family protein [Planctomycetes bacterium]|jgi:8-amino-7-oxononanoate synthase|nr:pyridoxal phosphate-dependent aminotransferase family protein [Planctomycetota bacterium]MCL4728983.1 pyridoxal phosphate-dependent aminotransferase family protein [Planctomycetota bacterium]
MQGISGQPQAQPARQRNFVDVFAKCYDFKRDLEVQAVGLYPFFKTIEGNMGSRVVIDGREVVMAGSNNYLGLTRHPKVVEAALEATRKYGTSCSGSRYANGTYVIHVELEERLAAFMGKPKALCFTTGYTTNMGAISVLAGRRDIILSDRENHSCIMDATQLSFAETKKYKHDDIEDLERVLEGSPADAGKLLVTDGVFSMKGTLARLPEIVRLKKKYGMRIFVDDAHGVGVVGKHGRGTAEHFGLEADVDVVMGTFSKSFAGLGGFIAGEERVISYVKHHARQLIFAASMTPASVAAVTQSLKMIQSEPEHLDNLRKVVAKVRAEFKRIGYAIGEEATPIVYIKVGEDIQAFQFWKDLLELGVYTNPVITPGVPQGQSGVRASFMAIHNDRDLAQVIEAFEKLGRKYGLIK